ncbi:MAG: acetolactate synthase small subunit, partial [Longicatena sp.]
RVTTLFSQRGFNIDTLAVGVSENQQFSRITITTSGDCNVINQIKLQLAKLEDVKIVLEIPDEQLFIREVVLIKVQPSVAQYKAFRKNVDDFGGRIQIIQDDCYIVEFADTPATIDYFIEELREFHISELSRTGGAALELSNNTVY